MKREEAQSGSENNALLDALEGMQIENIGLPNFAIPNWDGIVSYFRRTSRYVEATVDLQYPVPGQRVLLVSSSREPDNALFLRSTKWNRIKVTIGQHGRFYGSGYFWTPHSGTINHESFDSRVHEYAYRNFTQSREEQSHELLNTLLVLHQFRREVYVALHKRVVMLSHLNGEAAQALKKAFGFFETDLLADLAAGRRAAHTIEKGLRAVMPRFEKELSCALSKNVFRLCGGDKTVMNNLDLVVRSFKTLKEGAAVELIAAKIAAHTIKKCFEPLIPHLVVAELSA